MKCIVEGCNEERRVFAHGKGRTATRCAQHTREILAARKAFDEIQQELIRLGDQSGRVVPRVSRFTRKSA